MSSVRISTYYDLNAAYIQKLLRIHNGVKEVSVKTLAYIRTRHIFIKCATDKGEHGTGKGTSSGPKKVLQNF
jgi:hypothetical protein